MREQATWHYLAESDEILAILSMTFGEGVTVRIYPNGGAMRGTYFSLTTPTEEQDRVLAQIRVRRESMRLANSRDYQDPTPLPD